MSFANRLRMEKENESPLEKQQKTKKDAAAAQHAGKKRAHNEFDREEEEADNNGGEDSNAAVTEDDGSEMVVYEWDCDKVRQMIRGFLEENGTRESSPSVSHFLFHWGSLSLSFIFHVICRHS